MPIFPPNGSSDAIESLTGDGTATGPGAAAFTIAADAVTNAKLAEIATKTIKGNATGDTANPTDLTAAQVQAILSDEHYTLLSGTSNAITVSSLDGDVDGDYVIDGGILVNGGNNQIAFAPNSQTSNLIGISTDVLNGASADATGGTTWCIGRNGQAPNLFADQQKLYFTGVLRARSGRVRYILVNVLATGATNAFASGFSRNMFTIQGVWTDTAANLTTFQLNSNVSGGFGIGSWMRLRRTLTAN